RVGDDRQATLVEGQARPVEAQAGREAADEPARDPAWTGGADEREGSRVRALHERDRPSAPGCEVDEDRPGRDARDLRGAPAARYGAPGDLQRAAADEGDVGRAVP